MSEFEGVVPALGKALADKGYETLTPVQVAVLAPELADADMLVSAQTGSGKTVAFGMAFAPNLLEGADRFLYAKEPLALVVAPTRELALQVKRELDWLYAKTGASVASCVGGMDMRTERRVLDRGAHIVVGTPGRLRDHIERGSLDLLGIKAIVLDEADEMLDLGFRDDLEYILDASPKERRTLMFSATVPRTIAGLAKRYQRDAQRISTAAEKSQHLDIEYRAMTVAPNDRENAIVNVLRYFDAKNALVFCATRATVNHMTSRFTNRGFSVVALSGELSQNERSHALQAMRDGRARVCIATDVAARGIDLPNLELVIHADLPRNREALLHRSGRTGRAGRKGVSALIVPHNWRRRTETLLGNAKIDAKWGKPPSADEIAKKDREKILTDPGLSTPLNEDEQAFAKDLLERHSAEQVAAAFLRQHMAGQTAPEELLDTAPAERSGKRRESFKGGKWISLTVGRFNHADPKWLLPMLCRAGHITKNDIGAIKIQERETFVELSAEAMDKFLEAVGPSRKVEKSVEVTLLDRAPKEAKGGGGKPYEKKKRFGDKKPFRGDKPRYGDKPSRGDKPSYSDKPSRGDKPSYGDKPSRGDKPSYSDKPSRGDKPSYGDKPSRGDKPSYGDKPKRSDKRRAERLDDDANTDKRPPEGFSKKPKPKRTKLSGKKLGLKTGGKKIDLKAGSSPLKRKKKPKNAE